MEDIRWYPHSLWFANRLNSGLASNSVTSPAMSSQQFFFYYLLMCLLQAASVFMAKGLQWWIQNTHVYSQVEKRGYSRLENCSLTLQSKALNILPNRRVHWKLRTRRERSRSVYYFLVSARRTHSTYTQTYSKACHSERNTRYTDIHIEPTRTRSDDQVWRWGVSALWWSGWGSGPALCGIRVSPWHSQWSGENDR